MQRLAAQKRKGLGTTKSVDTVQLFMENNCVRTKFDTDVIKVGDFKTQYNEFCEANRLSPLNITRSLMASYGIETEKLELSYVCRKAPGPKPPKVHYNLKIEKADRLIERLVNNYLV